MLGMVVISFIFLVIFGETSKGKRIVNGLLLSPFVPLLTPVILIMLMKIAYTDKSWILALYAAAMMLIIVAQVVTFYSLRS